MLPVQTVSVRDAQLAHVDSGPAAGDTFVLSHSLFFDHTMFDPLTELLVAAGHRVVAYDHRGQGASSTATRAEQTMDELTADAAGLIEALDLPRVHFVGNSMGGFVALRLAARRPDLLKSVAALGSSAEEEYQLEAFAPLVEQLGLRGGAPLIDSLLHIMFGDSSLAAGGSLIEHWSGKMSALTGAIGDSAHNVIYRERIVEELADCPVPVIAIAGAEDHAYPPPISDRNIAAATGGEHHAVPGAGHSVALEQPGPVAEILLASLPRRSVQD
ncbi:alpha/beta fold hydrolase [Gordonia caeni]|uniref:Alpha/beta fold hydrolase n=1 Tax=Gordonia caeni TaxID=1007097 RepID=A0ABP7NSW3_9ACTN